MHFQPPGVTVSSNGTLFIADTANNRVRAVSPSGIISTLAGNGTAKYAGDRGAATGASLNGPTGMAVGPDGASLYIADTLNNVIRLVNATSRVITTVAGNGQYGYSGDLNVPTLARLSFPRGVAVASDGTLYIADTNNNVIRRVQ